MANDPDSSHAALAPALPPTASPRIGLVSLGCPKALVDSERIITQLRAEGYAISPDYAGADAVIVNTCGFLDSARTESLEAIGEALHENGKVIVTGCLGAEADVIRGAHPAVLAITGPHQYEAVMEAVRAHAPRRADPFIDLIPEHGFKLTPRHYAYLKISEGCNNRCSFCIIPSMRGDLVSRPANAVLREAEKLVNAGVKELLVISQDTSAYGVDIRYAESQWRGRPLRARFYDLAEALGDLGVWVRLHYVYPYPHVDDVIPLMAAGKILPYLDIPFQHAAPRVLKAMRRPANQDRVLERIHRWRQICPDLTIRSSFIVGFPGETDADFETLLDFLEAADIDRAGCFKYENVTGAVSRDLPDHVEEHVKAERYGAFMERATELAEAQSRRKIGKTLDVLIDAIDAETGDAIGRSFADAPEIDGSVRIMGRSGIKVGDLTRAMITDAEGYDLVADERPKGLSGVMKRRKILFGRR
ncbi:MAG TPA: 30S ribosomal protein S12 methylthiotransferase RimO [Hyphomonadaceae bacterium]|nr:30S ribosomal protein S12 methylthiotransferase RimO [Hyphomonadaceae bacterium]